MKSKEELMNVRGDIDIKRNTLEALLDIRDAIVRLASK